MKFILTLVVALMPFGAFGIPVTSAPPVDTPDLHADGTALAACYKMTLCGGGDGHYMHSGPSGPYQNFHANCLICIDPGGCHPGCDDQLAANKPDYQRMVAAAEELDVEGVLDAAKLVPEFAFYNSARSSVQVLSCDGETVIASLPVDGLLRHVASAQLRGRPGQLIAVTQQ